MMIIVSGLPGSGKRYFASRLAERLNVTYIISDLTRKTMDAMGQYALEDKMKVYEEMARRAGDALRHGNKIVVDGTSRSLQHLLQKPWENDLATSLQRRLYGIIPFCAITKNDFHERVLRGFKRDVHGDLHSGNIFLYSKPVIFDCIEFNDAFRQIDVIDEIAFFLYGPRSVWRKTFIGNIHKRIYTTFCLFLNRRR